LPALPDKVAVRCRITMPKRLCNGMVEAIKAGSHGSFIPFDREGQPMLFE
jgi:hypothetical protein